MRNLGQREGGMNVTAVKIQVDMRLHLADCSELGIIVMIVRIIGRRNEIDFPIVSFLIL